jgi:hypothetical protein
MATTSYRLQGEDGPVECDGQRLTIKRRHLRDARLAARSSGAH